MGYDVKHTKIKEVDGLTIDVRPDLPTYMRPRKIIVRITKDEKGKSLSLADELRGILLEVPLEPIENTLRWVMNDAR